MNDNPHGFVYAEMIDTYKEKKNERLARERAEREMNKDEYRQSFKRGNKKGGGTSNLAKLKNKPFNMVLPKKASSMREKRDGKVMKKKKMNQLGSYNKRTKDKIESKKRRMK